RTAIERTGLSGKERHRPDELSYGYQRRVEIARAIASEPTLLLLDEPTAGMNRQERDDITGLLDDLRGEGLTQLLIEHDVQMMVDACDHLFAMNFGELIADGEPESVVRHPAVQEAYLGTQGRAHARGRRSARQLRTRARRTRGVVGRRTGADHPRAGGERRRQVDEPAGDLRSAAGLRRIGPPGRCRAARQASASDRPGRR